MTRLALGGMGKGVLGVEAYSAISGLGELPVGDQPSHDGEFNPHLSLFKGYKH